MKFRFFILVLLSLGFLSCGNDDYKPDVVTPGTGSIGSVAFSKSCSEGSFQIYKQSVVGAIGYSQISGLDSGTSVTVKGVINSSPCHSGSSINFTCKGSVAIDTNRAIVCVSGTVQSGYATTVNPVQSSNLLPNLLSQPKEPTAPTTVPANPNIYLPPSPTTTTTLPTYSSVNITGGQVFVYDNGTKAAISLQFPHPSKFNVYAQGGFCLAGLKC